LREGPPAPNHRYVADIEQNAFKRDRRFLVRLVLVLTVGLVAGMWMFFSMTGQRAQGCAAEAVGGVAGEPASE
jgi:hypothetical protein